MVNIEKSDNTENNTRVSEVSCSDPEDQKGGSSDSDKTGNFSVNADNSVNSGCTGSSGSFGSSENLDNSGCVGSSGSSGSSECSEGFGSLESSENTDNSDNSEPADDGEHNSGSMPVPCAQNSDLVNSGDSDGSDGSDGLAVSEYNAQNVIVPGAPGLSRVRRSSDVKVSDVVEYSEEAVAGAKKSLSVLKLHMYSFFLICICLAAGFVFLLIFSIHFLSNLYDFLTGMVTDAIASFKDFLELDDYTTDSVKDLARKYGELFNRMRNTGRQILFAVSILLSIPAAVIGGLSLACASAAGRCIRTFSSADSHGYSELVRRIRIAALINIGSCLAVTLSLLSSWSSLIFLFTFNVTSVITTALIIRYFSVYGAMKDIVSGRRLDGPDYILMVIFLAVVVIGLIVTDLTVFPLMLILPF